MRIGIFGGSFDPVHKGHIALAESALKELKLNRLFFIPAKKSPLKKKPPFLKTAHRLKLLRLALKKEKQFRISSCELNSPGHSYTISTIRKFRKRFSKSDLFFIMGSDSLKDFKKWKSWKKIPKLCVIAAGMREGVKIRKENLPTEIRKNIYWLKSKIPQCSSTEIRKTLCENEK